MLGAGTAAAYPLNVQVLDAYTREPLIGANIVLIGGGGKGWVTDEEGRAVLDGLKASDSLQISYVGYVAKTLPFYLIADAKGLVLLEEEINLVSEAVVIAPTKFEERLRDIPAVVEPITAARIAHYDDQTTAGTLESTGAVFVQRSQMGGGSPVLRGFEANKVLIVLDGVRLNNAVYRNGHLQNIITVDNAMLERAEVIFGPAAVMYGSDALGGVMSLYSKDPQLLFGDSRQNYISTTNAFLRYSSANNERSAHIDYNIGGRRWASLTSFSLYDFGDMRAGTRRPADMDTIPFPDDWVREQYVARINGEDIVVDNPDPFLQVGTGYRQIDFTQKLRYKPNDAVYYSANVQVSTSTNIPRYDNLTARRNGQLRFAEWDYGPQSRVMASLRADLTGTTRAYSRGYLIAAYQRLNEDRFDRRLFSAWRDRTFDDVHVFSLNADFNKDLHEDGQHRLYYGAEYVFNDVISTADRINVENGQILGAQITRYASGGNWMSSYAAYVSYRWRNASGRVNATAGLRYSNVLVRSIFQASDVIQWPFSEISTNPSNLTGSLGSSAELGAGFTLRAALSTAFRSPNVDDFSKIRIQDGYILIPNPELGAENAYNAEATLSKRSTWGSGQVDVGVTAFYTYLYDAIVRTATTLPNGDSILVAEGEAQRVIMNTNASTAYIWGWSANLRGKFGEHWQMRGSLNFTKGRYLTLQDLNENGDQQPLSHIPPLYGMFSIGYQAPRYSAEAAVNFNGRKPLSEYDPTGGNSDNIDQAIEDFGTPAWHIYDLRATYHFNAHYRVQFAVENIFDLHYRTFSSGVSAPGRNFIVSLRATW